MEALAYDQFRELEDRHWWFRGRKAIFRHLLPLAAPREAEDNGHRARVLDLGCGAGGMLSELAAFGDVYGTDMAQDALAMCRERGFSRLFKATGGRLPFPDGSLDLVTMFDTLEHIPEERETLTECLRVLKPGGHVLISVPAYQWLYTNQDRLVHHQRRYTVRGLKRKLRSAGFDVTHASYINFILFPLILPVVLLMKLKQAVIRPPEDSYFTNASFPVPGWLNALLARVFGSERRIVRHVCVPVGHSLLAIGRKPAGAE